MGKIDGGEAGKRKTTTTEKRTKKKTMTKKTKNLVFVFIFFENRRYDNCTPFRAPAAAEEAGAEMAIVGVRRALLSARLSFTHLRCRRICSKQVFISE